MTHHHLFSGLDRTDVSAIAVCDPDTDATITTVSSAAHYAAIKSAARRQGYTGESIRVYPIASDDGERISHRSFEITMGGGDTGFRTPDGRTVGGRSGSNSAEINPAAAKRREVDVTNTALRSQGALAGQLSEAQRAAYENMLSRREAEFASERVRAESKITELERELRSLQSELQRTQERHAEALAHAIKTASDDADHRIDRIRESAEDARERLEDRHAEMLARKDREHVDALGRLRAQRDEEVSRVESRLTRELEDERATSRRLREQNVALELELRDTHRQLSEAKATMTRLRSSKMQDAEATRLMLAQLQSADDTVRPMMGKLVAAQLGVDLPDEERPDPMVAKLVDTAQMFLRARHQQARRGSKQSLASSSARAQRNGNPQKMPVTPSANAAASPTGTVSPVPTDPLAGATDHEL